MALDSGMKGVLVAGFFSVIVAVIGVVKWTRDPPPPPPKPSPPVSLKEQQAKAEDCAHRAAGMTGNDRRDFIKQCMVYRN
jgi:hypothetical protein